MDKAQPLTCPYCDTPFKGKPEDGYLCAKCLVKFQRRHI